MKRLLALSSLLSLLVSASAIPVTAFASAPLTEVQYAKAIANAFTQFQKPLDAMELLKEYTPARDRKVLQDFLEKHPFSKLPVVRANGSNLQFNFSGRIQTMRVIDGAKGIYSINGVEIDLNMERPLIDRLAQIELLANPKHASWWNIVLPIAEAQYGEDPGTAISYAAAAAVPAALSEHDKAVDANYQVGKIHMLCDELTKSPNTDLPVAFTDKTSAEVRKQIYGKAKNRPKRDKEWQNQAKIHLEKILPKYCKSGLWHEARKWLPENYTSEMLDDACESIKKTVACLKGIEHRKDVLIYREQQAEVVEILTKIEPGLSQPGTALVKEIDGAASR